MHLSFISGMPGGVEILIILLVILLLFGGKKLPELARALGRSLNEFRKGREESAREEARMEPTESGDTSKSSRDDPGENKGKGPSSP